MEDIKELFKELVEELKKNCSGWDSAPETEADKTFKEKILDLVKENTGQSDAQKRHAIPQK